MDFASARCCHAARWIGHLADLRPSVRTGRRLARHRRYCVCHKRVCIVRRNSNHGATATSESSEFFGHLRGCVWHKSLADSSTRRDRRGLWHPAALRDPGRLTLRSVAPGLSVAESVEKHSSTDLYRNHRFCSGVGLSFASARGSRANHRGACLPRDLRLRMVLLQALGQADAMKRILVTGASSGIGLAIAKSLVAQGHEVWGTSRNLERIPKMPRLHPIRLDLADRLSIEHAFNSALAEAGYLDVLINNAGAGHFGPAELLPLETITSQFQILVFGQIQLMQLALAAMRGQGHGLIINITSLASRLPVPFMAAYNAAKAALASFTMSIQLELPDSRVGIVDLQPADISTEFNKSVVSTTNADQRYAGKISKTWEIVERNMKKAPGPDLVARHVLRLINTVQPPPRITVGDAFQSKIATLIFRFLPQRVRLWGLRRYYKL